jgi:hypothetical protein
LTSRLAVRPSGRDKRNHLTLTERQQRQLGRHLSSPRGTAVEPNEMRGQQLENPNVTITETIPSTRTEHDAAHDRLSRNVEPEAQRILDTARAIDEVPQLSPLPFRPTYNVRATNNPVHEPRDRRDWFLSLHILPADCVKLFRPGNPYPLAPLAVDVRKGQHRPGLRLHLGIHARKRVAGATAIGREQLPESLSNWLREHLRPIDVARIVQETEQTTRVAVRKQLHDTQSRTGSKQTQGIPPQASL